jgi:hypothetical protein
MARTLQIRRGTAAQWTTANPILAQGEPGFETDTNRFKLGDGATAWNSLSYQGAAGAAVTALTPLTVAADKLAYYTSASAAATTDLSAYARSLLAVANEAALKALINAEGGVDFATQGGLDALTSTVAGKQASNARLTDIAGLTLAQGDVLYWSGTNFVKLSPGTSGQYLKTNGAGANPAWDTVSQTGRWVFLEKQEPTSDVSTITFSADISAYQCVKVQLIAQMTSATYPIFECSPDGSTWRTIGLGPTTPTTDDVASWFLEVTNVDNADGTNLRVANCIHSAVKGVALDRSSNATNFNATGIDSQAGTGGYTSYNEAFARVRFRANAGNFEGSNSDARTVATLWGMT